jgi:hypothetical protein
MNVKMNVYVEKRGRVEGRGRGSEGSSQSSDARTLSSAPHCLLAIGYMLTD